ncbi:MAG: sodium-dependent transporter [Alphaproteobacteria bacterium]|jgi:NSS family neurotransmitter:Na+ symporter|nr:sodium-dependent transporter [Alphaproteobacteria bacterium]
MTDKKNNRTLSKLGFIFVAAGSAIGLGNIWRFPYFVAEYSGGTFIFAYLFFAFFIGFSVMLSEFIIGRYLGYPFLDSLKSKLKHGTFFSKAVYLNLLGTLVLISFYFVVTSWTFYYFVNSLLGFIKYNDNPIEYYAGVFNGLLVSPITLIAFSFLVTISTVFINLNGLVKGVERINFFFLPALFVILVILTVRILSLDNATSGLKYIFTFNINDLPKAILPALGQALLSLSIGITTMVVFASHTSKNYNITSSAASTVALCSISGVFASILIIPAVFAFGYDMSSGPGLTFLTLPKVFSNLGFGVIFSTLFFFVFALAAFTSCISMIETAIPYVVRIFKTNRKVAIFILAIYCFITNIVMSLSLNVWSGFKIFGMDIFSLSSGPLIDNMLIVGVLLIILTLAIGLSKETVKGELTNNGTLKFHFFRTWMFLTIFITPIIIVASVVYSIFG